MKLYYKPIVLGLAALALGSQVTSVTTVLADDVKTDVTTDQGANELAAKKAALKEKMGQVGETLKTLNGTTPATVALTGIIAYAPHTSLNDSASLTTVNAAETNFNDNLAKVSINNITMDANGKDVVLENVPLEDGKTTTIKNVPAELNLQKGESIQVKLDADGKPTVSIVKGHVMGQADDPKATPVVVPVKETTSKKVIEDPATTPETPDTPDTPETKPEEPKKDDGKDTKPEDPKKDDEKDTKPEEKPADEKTIVSHKTTFLALKPVTLYDINGVSLGSRALGKNSAWLADKLMTLNGVKYLRVATNEWAKLSDGLEIESLNTTVTTKSSARLFTVDGEEVGSRQLAANSAWYTDRSAIINGEKMYRVSTSEWLPAANVK